MTLQELWDSICQINDFAQVVELNPEEVQVEVVGQGIGTPLKATSISCEYEPSTTEFPDRHVVRLYVGQESDAPGVKDEQIVPPNSNPQQKG
jgi:hypothetical protein